MPITIEVHGDYFITEKKGYTLELASFTKKIITHGFYKEIHFEGCYFYTVDQKGRKTLFNLEQDTMAHGFRNVFFVHNAIILQKARTAAILNCSGEILVENARELNYTLPQQIIGFDADTKHHFSLFNSGGELVLNYEKFITFWSNYALYTNSKEEIVIRDSNNNMALRTQYNYFTRQGPLLLLGEKELNYSVFNTSLTQIIDGGLDYVGRTDHPAWFIYRKDNKYGLVAEAAALLPAEYQYIKINNDLVYAYKENSLTIFNIVNNRASEEERFDNFISVNAFSNLPPLQDERNTRNTGLTREEWFQGIVTVGDPEVELNRWGMRNPKDTNDVYVAPKYVHLRRYDNRFDICNIRRGQLNNYIYSGFLFDVYDSELKKKINEVPFYNIRAFSRDNQRIFMTKTSTGFHLYNDTFQLSHRNIAYIDGNWNARNYRYCTYGNGPTIGKYDESNKWAISMMNWVRTFNNFILPQNISLTPKEREEYLRLVEENFVEFKGGKWGYMDFSGNKLFDEEFDYVEPLTTSMAKVYRDGKQGAVNGSQIIVPPNYHNLQFIELDEDTLIRVMSGNTYSKTFINRYGDTQDFPHQIIAHSKWNNGKKVVTFKEKNKYGLLDLHGNVIYSANSSMEPIVKEDYILVKERKTVVLDFKGNSLVAPAYSRILAFNGALDVHKLKGKLGVGTSDGEEILPAEFQNISLKDKVIIAKKGALSEVYDYHGTKLSNDKWTYADYHDEKGIWVYVKKGKKFIYCPTTNQRTKLKIGDNSPRFCGDFLCITEKAKSKNLYPISGEPTPLLEQSYTDITHYRDGLFHIFHGKKKGMANSEGTVLLAPNYRRIEEIYPGVFAGVYKQIITAVNEKGDTLFERRCTDFDKCTNGWLCVKSEEGAVYYDSTFTDVFGTIFDDAKCFLLGAAPVKADGFWTIINEENEQLFEPSYRDISVLSKDLFVAESKAVYGIYSKTGNVVAEAKYERAYKIDNNTMKVIHNGEIGYVNKFGEWIHNPFNETADSSREITTLQD